MSFWGAICRVGMIVRRHTPRYRTAREAFHRTIAPGPDGRGTRVAPASAACGRHDTGGVDRAARYPAGPVWALLASGTTHAAIAATLRAEYALDPEDAEERIGRDVTAMLQQLHSAGLLAEDAC